MASLQSIFAGMSNKEAVSVYHAIAQWADNESSRDDTNDPHQERNGLCYVEAVVRRLEQVLADLTNAPHDKCAMCGHQCPKDRVCDKCGSDPMAHGDSLCVDCDALLKG